MSADVPRRFSVTAIANVSRAALSFGTSLLLARWLGPQEYGTLAFLTGTFLGVRQLLDLGTSQAFFTFLSQRARPRSFVLGFFAWQAVQFALMCVVLGLLAPDAWLERAWQGEARGLVVLAFAAVFLQNSVWPAVQQAGESQRRTARVQFLGSAVMAIHLLAVYLLWRFGLLGLYAVYAALLVEYLAASLLAHRGFRYASDGDRLSTAAAFRMYSSYCAPLAFYSAVGFAGIFADRWLLQRFGGGVEQAYYGVGAQFATIALLGTTSVLSVYWKEMAEANHERNAARMKRLFNTVSRSTYLLSALAAGFLIPWASDVLALLLGDAYLPGATTLAIMFLYPVHQSLGQIGGATLYATERVRLLVVSGTIFTVLGIVASYFVLAPPGAPLPGMGLASRGLALKMVGVQLLSVNVTRMLIVRGSSWSFDGFFQVVSLGSALALGFLSRVFVHATPLGPDSPRQQLLMGGLAYGLCSAFLVLSFPSLAGLTRAEVRRYVRSVFD